MSIFGGTVGFIEDCVKHKRELVLCMKSMAFGINASMDSSLVESPFNYNVVSGIPTGITEDHRFMVMEADNKAGHKTVFMINIDDIAVISFSKF